MTATVYKARLTAKEQLAWCREHFGGHGDPYVEYAGGQVGIDTTNLAWWLRQEHLFFREQKDYNWFLLRWSSE